MRADDEKGADPVNRAYLAVRDRVRELIDADARMIGIVVREKEDGEMELIYLFDRGGRMEDFRFSVLPDQEIDSVADLFPGALSLEREAVDMFGLNFKGVRPGMFLVEGRSPVAPLRKPRGGAEGEDVDG